MVNITSSKAKATNIIKIAIGELKKKRKRRRKASKKSSRVGGQSSFIQQPLIQPIYTLGSRQVLSSPAPPISTQTGQRDVTASQTDLMREKRIEALTQSVKKLQRDVLIPKSDRIKEAKKNAEVIDTNSPLTPFSDLAPNITPNITTPKSTGFTTAIGSLFKSAQQSQVRVLPPQEEEEMQDILVEDEPPIITEPVSQKKLKEAYRMTNKRRLIFELDKIHDGYIRNNKTGKNIPKEQWINGTGVTAEDLKNTIARKRGSDYVDQIESSNPEFVMMSNQAIVRPPPNTFLAYNPPSPDDEEQGGGRRLFQDPRDLQREYVTSSFQDPQQRPRQGRPSLMSIIGGGLMRMTEAGREASVLPLTGGGGASPKLSTDVETGGESKKKS